MSRALPILCLLCVLPGEARAWDVQRASESGVPVHWEAAAIPYWVASEADGIAPEDVVIAMRDAADAWESLPCHLWMAVHQGPPSGTTRSVDGENRILFIREGWEGTPAEIAITHLTLNKFTGRIADADLTVNDEGFVLTTLDIANPLSIDLRGLLTHEWGHWMGLAHSFVDGSTMEAMVDGRSSPRIAALSSDDIDGICSLYEPRALPEADETTARMLPPMDPPRRSPPIVPILLPCIAFLFARFPRARLCMAVCLFASCANTATPGDVDSQTSPDAEDATTPPLALGELLKDNPSWTVTLWENHDQVTDGDFVLVRFDESHARPLELQFAPEGILQWSRPGSPWPPQHDCEVRGSWSAEGDTLTWSRTPAPAYCPGLMVPAEETLSAHLDADTGALVLTSMAIDWSLGNSGATLRPHALHLQPAPPFEASCGGPDELGECILECSDDPSSEPLHLRTALSCMPPFAPEECVDVSEDDSGEEFTCERGCHAVSCALDEGGALSCVEVVTDQGCSGAPPDQDG